MDIHRRHRIAAGKVDAVEILGQLQQIAALFAISSNLLAQVQIPVVGGRRNIAKEQVVAPDRDCAVWIAWGDGELTWRLADHLHDKVAVHPHQIALDAAPGLAQQFQRLRVEENNADFFQDPHSAIVNGCNPLLGQRFNGAVNILGDAPRHLLQGRCSAPCSRARTPAASSASVTCHEPLLGGSAQALRPRSCTAGSAPLMVPKGPIHREGVCQFTTYLVVFSLQYGSGTVFCTYVPSSTQIQRISCWHSPSHPVNRAQKFRLETVARPGLSDPANPGYDRYAAAPHPHVAQDHCVQPCRSRRRCGSYPQLHLQ